jgi:hypothetical protein
MTVIAFNFTKLSGQRKRPIKGKISISNNVAVREVEEAKLNLDNKKGAIRIEFTFVTKYEPDMGILTLEGDLVYLDIEAKIEEALAAWKKTKKLPKPILNPVLQTVFTRCHIQGLLLSKDLNLPPPVRLPTPQV